MDQGLTLYLHTTLTTFTPACSHHTTLPLDTCSADFLVYLKLEGFNALCTAAHTQLANKHGTSSHFVNNYNTVEDQVTTN